MAVHVLSQHGGTSADSTPPPPPNTSLARSPCSPSKVRIDLVAPARAGVQLKTPRNRERCLPRADQLRKRFQNNTAFLIGQRRPVSKCDVVVPSSDGAGGGPRYRIGSKAYAMGQHRGDPKDLPLVLELIAQLEEWEEWEKSAADMSRPAEKRAREISIGFRWVDRGTIPYLSGSKERCERARRSCWRTQRKNRRGYVPTRSVSQGAQHWTEEEWEELFQQLDKRRMGIRRR